MATTGNPIIDALIAQAKANEDTEDAAAQALAGVAAKIQTAVQAAIANGASATQLQPLTQLASDLQTHQAALAAAIASESAS